MDMDFDQRKREVTSGPVAGMVLAYLALFLLLTAFTAPGHAQDRASPAAPAADSPRVTHAVRIETLTIAPSPEDLAPPMNERSINGLAPARRLVTFP